MIYALLTQLASGTLLLNFFRYITVRSALAGTTSFLLCVWWGPAMIRKLKDLSYGQAIREEGPQSHKKKAGTPTMGGILIMVAVLISCLIWCDLSNAFIWVQLFATLGFAAVGFIDDYAKVTKKRSLGLTARGKMAWLMAISAVVAFGMYTFAQSGYFTTEIYFPFFKNFHPNFGLFFIPFAMLVLIGASNAVNLTDGLDGLAIGSSGISFATYTVIAYLVSNFNAAEYLHIYHIVTASELVVFGAAMGGACMGFLWYNAHPADVFMGDTGALGLGGGLGAMALLCGQPILLVIVGGLFVVEAISVMLQVASFKLRGKRIFRMAPIHHHFELLGWDESKVIIRFWIFAVFLAIFALSTFKLR